MTSYHEHTLAVIRNADILPADELQLLYRLAPEMEDTWQKRQVWRTDTEARVSVLNDLKHPTNASKYWQAVREQAVFVDQLVHLCYDYEAKQTERDALRAEAEELEEEAAATDRASTRRKLEAQARGKRIEANRCDYILLDMKLAAHHRLREIRMWSQIKAELDDGSFDTTDPNTHQLESYRIQFAKEADLALCSHAGPAELRNLVGKHLTAEREGDLRMRHMPAAESEH